MDWMYKGVSGLVDKEEYLTGRRIDKTFEVIQSQETQTKGDLDAYEPSVPGSVFDSNETNPSLVTIDLAAKLREDPLYEIRVKQREQRKKLLDNPLKLKKLKTILESTMAEDRDKHKRHKKKKKRRHSSSSSDSNSDSRLRFERNRHRRDDYKSDYKSSKHLDNRRDERKNKSHSNRESHSNDNKRGFHPKYDQKLKDIESIDKSRDKSNDRRIEKSFDVNKQKSKRLSAEDIEKKRKEMMENAVWRESQRKTNVKSYEAEEKAENNFNSSATSAQFIKPLLKSATESDSLEDRIKQKRFTSQRGYDTMDKNFAKK